MCIKQEEQIHEVCVEEQSKLELLSSCLNNCKKINYEIVVGSYEILP